MQLQKTLFFLAVFFLFGALKAFDDVAPALNKENRAMTFVNDGFTDAKFRMSINVPADSVVVINAQFFNLFVDPQLRDAILKDSASGVKQAIQGGACVSKIEEGRASLLLAIVWKKAHAVTALLDSGAAVDELLVECAINLSDIESAIKIARKCAFTFGNIYGEKSFLHRLLVLSVVTQRATTSALHKIVCVVRSGVGVLEKRLGDAF